jgi:transcriptional regulator with XRE-family HTH domain
MISPELQRLKDVIFFLKKKKLLKYQQEIAEKTDYAYTTISEILNGKQTLSEKFIKQFAKCYNVDPNFILNGEGMMVSEEVIAYTTKPKESRINPVPEDHYMEAAFYDLETAAGLLSANNLNTLPDSKKRLVPREYEKGKYLVVRVSGDSMDDGTKRSVPNGTELLIKEISEPLTERLPIKNYLFVIVAKDGTVLKQITEQNTSIGYLKCHSFNSLFQDYDIPFEDVVQIFKVLKKVNEKIVF